MFEALKARRAEAELRTVEARVQIRALEELSQLEDGVGRMEDPDSANWVPIGSTEKSLDEGQSDILRKNAQLQYYRNSHGRNIFRLFEKYVVGRGFQIEPESPLDEAKEWWKTFWRINKMELRKKEIVRRTMRDGESFIRYFPDDDKQLIVRFMSPDGIKNPTDDAGKAGVINSGVETDEEDIEEVLAYWFNGNRIEASEIQHIKILVDSDVSRGRSYAEPFIKDLVMFREWLTDRIKLNKIRSVVGLVKRVSGTPTQGANIAAANNTSRKMNPDGSAQHRMPKGVSVFTTNKGVDYEFLTPNLQAADVWHDGRHILLSIAAGAGLPEFMVTSDSSNANYASTLIAEAPGVKEFEDWQDTFAEHFKVMFAKVIQAGIEAGAIPEEEEFVVFDEEEVDVEVENDPFVANQIAVTQGVPPVREDSDEDTEEEDIEPVDTGTHTERKKKITERKEKRPTSTDCIITFPQLVHRDIKDETEAYVIQRDEEILSKHTMSSRLDLDFDEEQQLIAREDDRPVGEDTQADADYVAQRDSETHAGPPEQEKDPTTEE